MSCLWNSLGEQSASKIRIYLFSPNLASTSTFFSATVYSTNLAPLSTKRTNFADRSYAYKWEQPQKLASSFFFCHFTAEQSLSCVHCLLLCPSISVDSACFWQLEELSFSAVLMLKVQLKTWNERQLLEAKDVINTILTNMHQGTCTYKIMQPLKGRCNYLQ